MFCPEDVSFLFSPLEGSHPFFFVRDTLIVHWANPLASALGIREGFFLLHHISGDALILHRQCLRRDPHTCLQILQTPQNRILLPLSGIPGYTLLFLEYAYAPQGVLIRGVLFPGRAEYRRCVLCGDRDTRQCLHQMRNITPDIDERFEALLRAEHADGADAPPFDLRQAVLLTTQCLTVSERSGETPLFSVRELLENYCTQVMESLCFLACEPILEEEAPTPVFARLEPDHFLLLLTALFSIFTVLAEDYRVHISVYGPDEDAQLDFRIRCPVLAAHRSRCPDLKILQNTIPGKKFALTLADHIIGLCGYEVLLHSNPEDQSLTLSLFLPMERECQEFKSPAHSLFLLERAMLPARALHLWLHLLPDSQEKQ